MPRLEICVSELLRCYENLLMNFFKKFSVIELQAFVVELLSNFEFSAAPKTEKIRREAALVMVPTIEGEVKNGSQLPLRVKFAPKGGEE